MASATTTTTTTTTKALIVHPDWQHTVTLQPLTVSFWDECCDAVLTNIASRALAGGNDHATLASLMLVNQRCRRIATAEALWRQLCVRRFNTPPQLSDPNMTWRELYRLNHEAFKWLLAQTAADALMKLGVSSGSRSNNGGGFVLNMVNVS